MSLFDYVLRKLRKDEMSKNAGYTIAGMFIGDGLLLFVVSVILRFLIPDPASTEGLLVLSMGGVMLFAFGVLLVYHLSREKYE